MYIIILVCLKQRVLHLHSWHIYSNCQVPLYQCRLNSASRTLMDVHHKTNLKTKYEQTNEKFLNKYYGNVCLNIRSRRYVRSVISSYLHSNFSIVTEHWVIQTCVCCYLVGEHLRLCPQDYTCCSSQMEETLSLQSERDFLKAVEDSSQFLLTTFTQRHRRFDGENSQRARCLI